MVAGLSQRRRRPDEHAYRVIVTREDNVWLANVPELAGAHTYARSLPALDRAVREVVVMATDLPDKDMPTLRLTYIYGTGDAELDAVTAEVRALRARAEEFSSAATARTNDAAALLVRRGLSVRDAAALLGVSPQRISQITPRKPTEPADDRRG